MSVCLALGKDRVILATKKDHETPSKIELPAPDESEQKRGLILPNGELNWSCPCLGFMPYGPCGYEFREAFTCIHEVGEKSSAAAAASSSTSSDEEAKEKESRMKAEICFPKFKLMKECFAKYPKLYPPDDDDDDEK